MGITILFHTDFNKTETENIFKSLYLLLKSDKMKEKWKALLLAGTLGLFGDALASGYEESQKLGEYVIVEDSNRDGRLTKGEDREIGRSNTLLEALREGYERGEHENLFITKDGEKVLAIIGRDSEEIGRANGWDLYIMFTDINKNGICDKGERIPGVVLTQEGASEISKIEKKNYNVEGVKGEKIEIEDAEEAKQGRYYLIRVWIPPLIVHVMETNGIENYLTIKEKQKIEEKAKRDSKTYAESYALREETFRARALANMATVIHCIYNLYQSHDKNEIKDQLLMVADIIGDMDGEVFPYEMRNLGKYFDVLREAGYMPPGTEEFNEAISEIMKYR